MILRSFQDVFPHTSLWVASNCLNKHALILGSLTPLRIDLRRVAETMSRPRIAADLREVEIHDAYDLLDCYMCGEDAIRRLVAGDPTNTDDRPRLEFGCAVPTPWERSLARVLAMLTACRTPVTPNVVSFPDEARDRAELARRFRATTHIFHAQVSQLIGDPTGRRSELARALAVNPGEAHVRSCQAELHREIQDLRNALGAMPGSAALAVRLAGKLYVAGRHREAASIYQQLAQDETPVTPQVLTRLANLHFRAGRGDRAEQLLCRCLGIWHDCAEAHDLLAGLYLRKGRPDLARSHIAEALRIEPHNALYRAHRDAIHGADLAAGDTRR
jgi:Tfp pilus assembly protein PilF